MPTGTTDAYRVSRPHFLELAAHHPVCYEHPGCFIAGIGFIEVEGAETSDFLVKIARAIGADQPNAGTNPRSRFNEYDRLVRAVWVCRMREEEAESGQERIQRLFHLQAVNAADPHIAAGYTVPGQTARPRWTAWRRRGTRSHEPDFNPRCSGDCGNSLKMPGRVHLLM